MRFITTFCLLLAASAVYAQQNIEDLEARLLEATASVERMRLNYQLGEAYLRSNVRENEKKALPYAKEAFNLAVRNRDDGQAARSAFLTAQVYNGMKGQERNQEIWFKSAEDYARKAGDSDLIVKSVIKRGKLARDQRNYRRATDIYENAFNYFSAKGTSISELESRYEQEKALLEGEKARLEQQRLELETEIASLQEESQQLSQEKSELVANQDVLIREKERVEEEITTKEEELVTVSQAKAEAEKLAEQRQEEVVQLSREALEQRVAAQQSALDAAESRELTYLSLGLAGVLVFLALFLYARFRAKRRSANRIAQEKRRSDELLHNILPVEIANELKAEGKTKARKYGKASVLFSDFINFTSISEKLSPEELVEELDNCFQGFDEIISQYDDIEKIKTIGDAYMCASGLQDEEGRETSQRQSKPHNLIRAALKMQEFLRLRRSQRKMEGKQYFEARMGIHTGPVVAGVVGKKKFAYDIWGDTVNTASRIESNGEVDQVNISESTYDLVKDDFECQALGQIKAKNKGLLNIFRVLR